jgi:5-formyltetrahydrofolate cyclo-ligase
MTKNTADLLRTRLRASRRALPVAERQRGSLLIRARLFTWLAVHRDHCLAANVAAPSVIAAYWPLEDEPDLRPLLDQWDEAELTVVLPSVVEPCAPLHFYRWSSQTVLQTGPFGVQQPPPGQQIIPDVILVPTIGFTHQGDRIGFGKGYYDRTLAHLADQGHHPTTIGVAWEDGDISALDANYEPAEHDWRLDAIITPQNWYPNAPG